MAAPTAGHVGAGLAVGAQQFNGAPHVWGCEGRHVAKRVRLLRSRLVRAEAGVHLKFTRSTDVYTSGARVSLANLAPARRPGVLPEYLHAWPQPQLIYLGNGQFIHAVDESQGMRISSIGASYWTSRWFGATRLN